MGSTIHTGTRAGHSDHCIVLVLHVGQESKWSIDIQLAQALPVATPSQNHLNLRPEHGKSQKSKLTYLISSPLPTIGTSSTGRDSPKTRRAPRQSPP